MRTAVAATLAAVAAVTIVGCSGHAPRSAARPAAPATLATSESLPLAASPSPTTAGSPRKTHRVAARALPFAWSSAHVTAAQLGKSWRPGCPVGPDHLRALTLTFWGFDRAPHTGVLVVSTSAVPAIVAAFRRIYADRFPVRRMRPIAAYGGSDNASMADDNTSAFNCRYAVSNGPKSWSAHAYGDAVDIDPLENPYRLNGRILPPGGAPYMNRSDVRRGMVVDGSAPVRAFDAVGWGWGGRWSSTPDYQHFSSTGR